MSVDLFVICSGIDEYIHWQWQLVSDLQIIPAHDPRSLVLPVDPFETLTRTYRLTDLKPHEERWTASVAETLEYLKSVVKVPQGLSKSERAWLDDGDGEPPRSCDLRFA